MELKSVLLDFVGVLEAETGATLEVGVLALPDPELELDTVPDAGASTAG